MPDYLLEIGTEELPASYVPEAQEQLREGMHDLLHKIHLGFESLSTYGTPRRLAVLVRGVAAVQTTVTKKVKGPPVSSSFTANGQPLPPALGFAQKQGLTVDELVREEIDGVAYLVANVTLHGKPVKDVLQKTVPQLIHQLSCERPMRWGSADFKFSRPIRWLVSMLDDREVPIEAGGVRSSHYSSGHRLLCHRQVPISRATAYADDLRRAYVIADPSERQRLVKEQVSQATASVGGLARQLGGPLLDEVVNIIEWPSAILGEFAGEYLELPGTLIETVMVHHQRFFPVESAQDPGRLLPYFVTVANNDRPQAVDQIKLGNERVLKARLADGRFFYVDDRKIKLSQRKPALAQLTFQEGLGSYLDKQKRLADASRQAAENAQLEPRILVCLERAVELCKLDLVTNLVRELPELQGYVGSWYARLEGEPPDVVTALVSHYQPRSTEDSIPADRIGQILSLVDKLDSLVGLYAQGKRPSGSSDPFALRRQAQGVIDLLVAGLTWCRLDVTGLMQHLLELYGRQNQLREAGKGMADLREALIQRLRVKLLEGGQQKEVVEAVLAAGDPLKDVPDLVTRLKCVALIVGQADGLVLVRTGVRIGNILSDEAASDVQESLFGHECERKLWQIFSTEPTLTAWARGKASKPATESEYLELLDSLKRIISPVDQLFEQVMVNDPDPKIRANRHALLGQLDRCFEEVAEFPKLQPLLP